MNPKSRIELTDTMISAMVKMSDGNPGAVTVMSQLVNEGRKIDPLDVFGGFGNILSLDSHGIYGEKIWMLYKNVCQENIEYTITVLRACQLGILRESDMIYAIDNFGEGVDVKDLFIKVKERLDGKFGYEQSKGEEYEHDSKDRR